jgi:hypothetical protein
MTIKRAQFSNKVNAKTALRSRKELPMLPSVPNNAEDRPAQSKSVRQKLGGGVNLNGNIAFIFHARIAAGRRKIQVRISSILVAVLLLCHVVCGGRRRALQCYNRFLRWFARLQPTAAFVVCGNGLRGQGRMVVGDRKVHDNYLPFMVRSEFVKGKNPMEMARRFVLVLNGGGLVYKSVTYSIIERTKVQFVYVCTFVSCYSFVEFVLNQP